MIFNPNRVNKDGVTVSFTFKKKYISVFSFKFKWHNLYNKALRSYIYVFMSATARTNWLKFSEGTHGYPGVNNGKIFF